MTVAGIGAVSDCGARARRAPAAAAAGRPSAAKHAAVPEGPAIAAGGPATYTISACARRVRRDRRRRRCASRMSAISRAIRAASPRIGRLPGSGVHSIPILARGTPRFVRRHARRARTRRRLAGVAAGQRRAFAVEKAGVDRRRRESADARGCAAGTECSCGCREWGTSRSAAASRAMARSRVSPVGDHLGEQRIVVDRHLAAFDDAGVDADAGQPRLAVEQERPRPAAGSRARDPRRRRALRWRGRAA